VVPREEMTHLSQVQIVERFFAANPGNHWHDMPQRAKDFLHQLLELNPDKRLTATEALNHSWFKKPLSEAALLEARYQKVIRFWRKREDDEVIEKIPSEVSTNHGDQIMTSAPRSRRNIPDSTLSTYFSLDRHLQPKVVSKRKMILETLHQSGSPFLVTGQNQDKVKTANNTMSRGDIARVQSVRGIDLFGSFPSSKASSQPEPEVDIDEICLVPASSLVPHSERTFGFDRIDSLGELSSPAKEDTRELDAGVRKRKRRESEDPEERNIRDGVAGALPRYSTAKAFKDAVEKRKQEMKSKTLTGLVIRSSVPTA
jgi:serine/threonine protein kinase